jgi:two-component system nitrate/nitrite response regulator NarL
MTSVQTVLIVDDHPLFRQGIAQLIDLEAGFEQVGEAPSGQEGLALAQSLRPDIVLLDLNMKDKNGLEVLREIKAHEPDTLVIVVTVSDAGEDLIAALRTGADGYLLKDMEPEELLGKLKRASKGCVVVDESMTMLLAQALQDGNAAPPADGADLTERERDILVLIAEGMSNKVIARELEISDGTVKVHVKHLLRKLDLSSRLQAAAWAHEHGIKGASRQA